ncbi:hypothetical protein ACFLYO_07115 [Chloroflexota bacterium]
MLGFIVLIIVLIIFLLVTLSPLESLSWWAGWNRLDSPEQTRNALFEILKNPPTEAPEGVEQFVIFMTGIGGYAQDSFLPEERLFMDKLIAAMPNIKLVDDVYPYAATARSLGEGARFDRFWRYAVDQKAQRSIVGFTVNLRNLMQVLVAADPRYGQIYSRGISNILLQALHRHGYPFGSGMPVTLIGYSGGGEMSTSSIAVLNRALQAPIRVISLGGVMGNDPAIAEVDHFYHIYGDKDTVQIAGPILFPGRWRVAIFSRWNKARKDGTISYVRMGDMVHNGPGGYLDHENFLPDGRSYIDFTVDTMTTLITAYPDIIPEDKIGAATLQ